MSSPPSTGFLLPELAALLRGGNAHLTFAEAVKDFPPAQRGVVTPGLPYSAWQLIEHLRLAQRDILDFSAPGPEGYTPLAWPKEYWPEASAPPATDSWDRALATIGTDLERFIALLQTPGVDLLTPFPWGEGQNLLREALLIADHNSYHTGELVLLRRVLGIWPR